VLTVPYWITSYVLLGKGNVVLDSEKHFLPYADVAFLTPLAFFVGDTSVHWTLARDHVFMLGNP